THGDGPSPPTGRPVAVARPRPPQGRSPPTTQPPATPRQRRHAKAATAAPLRPTPPPATASCRSVHSVVPYFSPPLQPARPDAHRLLAFQAGGFRGRPAVIGLGAADGGAVAPSRLGIGVGALLHLTLDGANAADAFLQFLLGVAVGFVKGPGGLAQVVEV